MGLKALREPLHNRCECRQRVTGFATLRQQACHGHHPARLAPALRPVMEAGVVANDVVRRSSRPARRQPSDLLEELRVTAIAYNIKRCFKIIAIAR